MREPVRTCVACRTPRAQSELVRVVLSSSGDIWVDRREGRRPAGRGAYVCPGPECIERALRTGALKRALRHAGPVPERLREELEEAARVARRDGRPREVEQR